MVPPDLIRMEMRLQVVPSLGMLSGRAQRVSMLCTCILQLVCTYLEPCACRPATLKLLHKNCEDRCEERAASVLGEYKVSH